MTESTIILFTCFTSVCSLFAVVKAYEEFFEGYNQNPAEVLNKLFEQVEGYDDMVLVKDIPFASHCEHHMAPIIGKASIAYLPQDHVVGISKLARVLHAVWDAGYWGLVLLVPPAILGCAWVVASEDDRQMFREDLNWWSNWLLRR